MIFRLERAVNAYIDDGELIILSKTGIEYLAPNKKYFNKIKKKLKLKIGYPQIYVNNLWAVGIDDTDEIAEIYSQIEYEKNINILHERVGKKGSASVTIDKLLDGTEHRVYTYQNENTIFMTGGSPNSKNNLGERFLNCAEEVEIDEQLIDEYNG